MANQNASSCPSAGTSCCPKLPPRWHDSFLAKRATPADLAASRIDFPEWLGTLSKRD